MNYINITEVCNISIGKTPSRNNDLYWGGDFTWLSISDLKKKYIFHSKEQITELGIKESGIAIIPKNTVIMSFKLSIGKVAIIKKDLYTNEAICAFHIKDTNKLHNEFLYYALQTLRLSDKTDRAVMGATLNKGKLQQLKIPLPPLEIQKRIVELLDKAQALIDKRKEQIALMDQLIQSIFYDMFGDININPFGWHYSKLFKLVKNKSDIVDGPFGSSINTKVDYIDNGEIPVIRTKNISKSNEFITDDLKFMNREKYETVLRSQVLPGDIILTKVGTIGNVCMFPDIFKEAVLSTTGSCRIRVDDGKINKIFLINYLNLYKTKMLEIASTGVQAFLNMTHVKNFDVYIPPLNLQNTFADRVQKIEAQKTAMKNSFQQLEDNFNSLMQRAFKGELT